MKYKRIKLKDGSTKDEHRLVMEAHLERPLRTDEIIHHINGDGYDNRLENLEITTRGDHTKEHIKKGEIYQFTPEDVRKGAIRSNELSRVKSEGDFFKCVKCKEMVHKDQFHLKRARWNGLQPYCKRCSNIKTPL